MEKQSSAESKSEGRILFENWVLKREKELFAQQFDHLTRTLKVEGDLPQGWEWVMMVKLRENMDCMPLEVMEGGIGLVLTAQQLAVSGTYHLQLRGKKGEQVRHTNTITVRVGTSLSGDLQWPEVPSEFTELERRSAESAREAETAAAAAQGSAGEAKTAADDVDAAKTAAQNAAVSAGQSAENAATSEQEAAEHKKDAETAMVLAESYTSHPPIVGENGNWWGWDGAQYEDSGKPSQGDLTRVQGNTLYGNTLKGTANGAAIRLDDVSPLEHTVPVKVNRKNLYFNNATKTATVQGTLVLETTAKKSEFVLNGATTVESAALLSSGIPLKAGTYTVSLHGTNIVGSYHDRIYVAKNSGGIVANYIRNGEAKSFAIEEDTIVLVQMVFSRETTYENATCYIQIEEGTTATAYTPYVDDLTAITVRTCGKNLSPVTSIDTEKERGGKIEIPDVKEPGTYTLSAMVTKFPDDAAVNTRMSFRVDYTDGTRYMPTTEYDTTFAENDGVARLKTLSYTTNPSKEIAAFTLFVLDYSSGGSRNARAENIQFEYAPNATDFEEYKGGTYALAEDGTCEVTSVAPTMNLLTDNPNVVVGCEYNRDINKAFEQLTQAILSMGGNI